MYVNFEYLCSGSFARGWSGGENLLYSTGTGALFMHWILVLRDTVQKYDAVVLEYGNELVSHRLVQFVNI